MSKASSNKHKYTKTLIQEQSKKYQEQLEEEINQDRMAHGKKPLPKKHKPAAHVHDSQVFEEVFTKVTQRFGLPRAIAVDAGYKTPYIAKQCLDDIYGPNTWKKQSI